tara:strand:- start:6856 stop:7494 length:639 start_codon:yes stop_codon:yes gene_type:complete
MITKEFTYALPDELWVEGVSGDVTGTWTYEGPETIKLYADPDDGTITAIDPGHPLPAGNVEVTIDANANPELAEMVAHFFTDDVVNNPTFEDVTMDNGDVFKKLTNPRMIDAYELRYDGDANALKLAQVLRAVDDSGKVLAQSRKDKMQSYLNDYDFGADTNAAIQTYIDSLTTYINDYVGVQSWKYINVPDSAAAPKIPAAIQAEINKLGV